MEDIVAVESETMDLNHLLQDFGTVTLTLSNLIVIQLLICGSGMLLAGLSYLCVYEPKLNGPLQSIIPIKRIQKLKKRMQRKHRNNQLVRRQQRDMKKQENRHLMSASEADYMTANQNDQDESQASESQTESGSDHHHDHSNEHLQIDQ